MDSKNKDDTTILTAETMADMVYTALVFALDRNKFDAAEKIMTELLRASFSAAGLTSEMLKEPVHVLAPYRDVVAVLDYKLMMRYTDHMVNTKKKHGDTLPTQRLVDLPADVPKEMRDDLRWMEIFMAAHVHFSVINHIVLATSDSVMKEQGLSAGDVRLQS